MVNIDAGSHVKIKGDPDTERICTVVYTIGELYFLVIPGYNGHYPYGIESLIPA